MRIFWRRRLPTRSLDVNVAVAGVKQAESSGGKTSGLIAALSKAGGLEPIVRALSARGNEI